MFKVDNMSKKIIAVNAGPTEVFVGGDTLQLKDYSKTDWQWTMFDPEAKQQRYETVFPEKCREAFELGKKLAQK